MAQAPVAVAIDRVKIAGIEGSEGPRIALGQGHQSGVPVQDGDPSGLRLRQRTRCAAHCTHTDSASMRTTSPWYTERSRKRYRSRSEDQFLARELTRRHPPVPRWS